MDLKDYQIKAKLTDQKPRKNNDKLALLESEVIPLLGLVGEVGFLLSEYKKKMRDGEHYTGFKENIKEELGDLLWYISNIAIKFDINLNEIAKNNLEKTKDRWCKPKDNSGLYDEKLSSKQQLPRAFSYKFNHLAINENKIRIEDMETKEQIGDLLTDNSYENDGYRYHDVMHMTFMACFGWSPVFRKLLRNSKRKNKIKNREGQIAEVEDGGRAQIIEESIIQMVYIDVFYNFQKEKDFVINWQLLRLIKKITSKLEINNKTTYEWNEVLKLGLENWKKLINNNGGIIEGNLLNKTITYRVS